MKEHIKINLAAFKRMEEDLKREHNLKHALFHNGKLVDIYNDGEDAYRVGRKFYPNHDFFIRQINAPALRFYTPGIKFITIDD